MASRAGVAWPRTPSGTPIMSTRQTLRATVHTLDEIVQEYHNWVTTDNYLILNRMQETTINGRLDCKHSTIAVLLAKRGNTYYAERTLKRFQQLTKNIKPITCFRPHDPAKKTRILWITLTYHTKRCPLYEAWQNISKEYNRFMANMRKQYGRIASIRCFEAFENGHPHIHACLIFQDTEFDVQLRFDGKTADGKNDAPCWRIKQDVTIETYWHSRVDVQAQQSTKYAINYIAKYITKAIKFEEATTKTMKTLALNWLFNRRSYSVSGKFMTITGEELTAHVLTKEMRTSNQKTTMQATFLGEPIPIYTYTFMGVVPGEELGLNSHQKAQIFIELTPNQERNAWSYIDESNK